MKTGSLAEPILVGRDHELQKLRDCLDRALSGKGEAVFVSGEAGSGKTRLAKEFLKTTKNEFIVLSGWCLSNAAIPYFPFVEAFNSYSSSNETQIGSNEAQHLKLKKWLIGQSDVKESENLNRQAWKDQTFASVTRELLLLSAQKPVIVFIDDIHWADSASLSLLHYLARAIIYERILLLATFRSEDLVAQLDAQNQPLAEILRIMRREDLYSEIKLTGLGQTEVGDIAESMLSGNVSGKLVERLTLETSGNPLFVVESLKMLSEQRGLIQENDCWIAVDAQFGVPAKVRDVILHRLNTLNPEARDVLDAGSVIGDKFDAQLIGAVLNQDTVKVLSILNSISKNNSLVCFDRDFYRFDHPKTREVLYEEISSPLRKEYHLKAAEKLETLKSNNSIITLDDLAYHYVNGGNKQKAIKYSIEAGKNALAGFSNTEAIRHFDYALEALGDSSKPVEKMTALEGLGDAYYASNKFKDAIRTFENLATISDSHVRQRVLSKAMESAFFLGDFNKVDKLVTLAEGYGDLDRLERARILHYKGAAINYLKGLGREGKKLCEESLKIFEEEYALSDAAWRLFVVADFASAYGELEKGIALSLRSIALYAELGDLRSKMEAYNEAGIVFQNCGLYPEAQKMFEKVLDIEQETKMGNHIMIAKANLHLSLFFEAAGYLTKAIETNLQALESSKKADSYLFLGMLYANLTRQYMKQNDEAQAEKYFERLTNILPSLTDSTTIFHYSLAKATFLASKNQWQQSIMILEQCFSVLRSKKVSPVMLVFPLAQYAWILNKAGQTQEAQTILQELTRVAEYCDRKFKHANIKAYVLAPIKVSALEPFEARIEIINISRSPCSIVSVRNLLPSGVKLKYCSIAGIDNNGNMYFEKSILEPFSVMTINLKLESNSGTLNLCPEIEYIDDRKRTKTFKPEPVQVNVAPRTVVIEKNDSTIDSAGHINQNIKTEKPTTSSSLSTSEKFEFKNQAAEKVFNFLIKAFIEDYMRRKLTSEKSGWRTLMEIIIHEKLPKSCMYGSERHKGKALVELERRGLVEARFFLGERGRGGKILRLRISYEKEMIRRQVDNCIMFKEK